MTKTGQVGMTLIEVMISTALFGILALAVASLSAYNARQSASAQNQNRLSEELLIFTDALDMYLSNATTIITSSGCDSLCGSNGTCDNRVLVSFETETSQDPIAPAYGDCVSGNQPNLAPPVILGEAMVLRGCKKRIRLVHTSPTTTGTTGSEYGILELQLEDPTTGEIARTLDRLTGVYSLTCGHTESSFINPSTGSPETRKSYGQFRIQLSAKARASNAPYGSSEYESWHPSETNLGFNRGVHRTFSADYSLDNLTARGIHLGATETQRNCGADGTIPSNGICCSGYKLTNGTCLPMANCKMKNNGTTAEECCSHSVLNGQCR